MSGSTKCAPLMLAMAVLAAASSLQGDGEGERLHFLTYVACEKACARPTCLHRIGHRL